MSAFDRIDKRFRPREPIKREKPQEGDPCPDPQCGGHYKRVELTCAGIIVSRPRLLRCTECDHTVDGE
jgi:hypothetical protein